MPFSTAVNNGALTQLDCQQPGSKRASRPKKRSTWQKLTDVKSVLSPRSWVSTQPNRLLTSVITLKPAIHYQFKTGQRDWPKT